MPSDDTVPPARTAIAADPPIVALLGNPNVGKTTLFNRLCGERHRTANFAGTTQAARIGDPSITGPRGVSARLVDLPGAYDLALDQNEARVCREALAGELAAGDLPARRPDVVLLVVDATNLDRGLLLVAEVLAAGHPAVVCLNMIDEATRRGLVMDAGRMASLLGCPVLATCARNGEGIDAVRAAVTDLLAAGSRGDGVEPSAAAAAAVDPADRGAPAPRVAARPVLPPAGADASERRAWIQAVVGDAVSRDEQAAATLESDQRRTDRFDSVLTHPVFGLIVFSAVMTGLFAVIFKLATYPMDWLDALFGDLGGLVAAALPPGLIADFLTDGVIAGIGGTVIFLPQICLLFGLLTLLEDSGYLPRAALVADRWLRPFGLSGHSFVPLLSAHACALPAIASARGIPDARERLATILVAPFMSCTARIPVYVLLTALLFPGDPLAQALAFTGCYVLGALAALVVTVIIRRTIARGSRRPMSLELPIYRRPSLKAAVLTMWDRGLGFLRKAGTVILLISVVLWWLGTFPQGAATPEADALRTEAASLAQTEPERAAELEAEAEAIDARTAAAGTFLARIGDTVQPVFAPLGYDRTLTVGVLASFAAREVFVTTVAVQVAGREDLEDEGLLAAVSTATRDDGTPIFTPSTSWSLLVFYVLAMQCLPTVVLTARETGGVRWGLLQLGGMTAIAWVAALAARQIALALGAV